MELAEHARDVRLHRLDRERQAGGDLLVAVAAGDQLQPLALTRRQSVELRVAADRLAGAKSVENEAGEARREHGIPLRDMLDRVGELSTGDRLGDVPARAGTYDADHVLSGVGDGEREKLHARPFERDSGDDAFAAAVGEVDIEQHDVRVELADQRNRLGDSARLADDVDRCRDLAADAGAEQLVIVDENDAECHVELRGSRSSTSVPEPGAVTIVAVPPARASLPSIDSVRPRRSSATAARSNPVPRSRTNTETPSAPASA